MKKKNVRNNITTGRIYIIILATGHPNADVFHLAIEVCAIGRARTQLTLAQHIKVGVVFSVSRVS